MEYAALGVDKRSVVNGFRLDVGSAHVIQHRFSSLHIQRLQSSVRVDEQLEGVDSPLDTLSPHPLVIRENLASIPLRGEEELHQAVVWRRPWLVISTAFHLLKDLLSELLI